MSQAVLFCASTAIHIKNFHLPYIAGFIHNGFKVDTMCQGELSIDGVSSHYNLPFDKKGRPAALLKSCLHVAKLLKQNRYDLITVHTTLAAGICRLALLLAGKRATVLIYTCHGYLYSACGGIKKLLGILCERVLSLATDAVVTMNRLDYAEAVRYAYAKDIYLVHGMGLDPQRLAPKSDKELQQLRRRLGIADNGKIFLCVGEFSPRKNQAMLIKAAAPVLRQNRDAYLVFAGDGALQEACKRLCDDLGVIDRVCFLGHCTEVPMLMQLCDFVVSVSLCEGLPFNIMEGLFFGKSIAASAVRGHLDLLSGCEGTWLFDPASCDNITQNLMNVMGSKGEYLTSLPAEYLLDSCINEFSAIYSQHLAKEIKLTKYEVIVS